MASNFTLQGVTITGMTHFAIVITGTADNISIINCRFMNTSLLDHSFSAVGTILHSVSPGKIVFDGCEISNIAEARPGLVGATINTSGRLEIYNSVFSNITCYGFGAAAFGSSPLAFIYISRTLFVNILMQGYSYQAQCAMGIVYNNGDVQIDDSIISNFTVNDQPICLGDIFYSKANLVLNRCSFTIRPYTLQPLGYSPLFGGNTILMNQCIIENTTLVGPVVSLQAGNFATINNCIFRNLSYSIGVHALFYNPLGTLNIANSTFSDFFLSTSARPLSVYDSNFGNITDSVFANNFVMNGNMLNFRFGTVSRSNFQNNTIPFGATLYIGSASTVSVLDSYFTNNTGVSGAITSEKQGSCNPSNIQNCTFINNYTPGLGPAIYNVAGLTTVNDCSFINNTGGGFYGAVSTASYFANCAPVLFANRTYMNVSDGIADTLITGGYFDNNIPMESGGTVFCPQLPGQICNGTISTGTYEMAIAPIDYCSNSVEPYESNTNAFQLFQEDIPSFCSFFQSTPYTGTINLVCPAGQFISVITYAKWGGIIASNLTECIFTPSGGSCDATQDITGYVDFCVGSNSCAIPLDGLLTTYMDPCPGYYKQIAVSFTCCLPSACEQLSEPWVNNGSYFTKNLTFSVTGEFILDVLFYSIPLSGSPATFNVVPGIPSANNTVCQGVGFYGSAYIGDTGSAISFTIQLYDAFGNLVTDPPVLPTVDVMYEGDQIPCTVQLTEVGSFEAIYEADNVGSYSITVYLDGEITAVGNFTALNSNGVWISPTSTNTTCTFNNYETPCAITSVPHFMYNNLRSMDAVTIFCFGGTYNILLMPFINNTVTIQPDPSIADQDVIFQVNSPIQFKATSDGKSTSVTIRSISFTNATTTAVYTDIMVTLSLIDVQFVNNEPNSNESVLQCMGDTNIVSSTFVDNLGEVLDLHGRFNSIVNSTFTNNLHASEATMVVYGDLSISNCTFLSNQRVVHLINGSLSVTDCNFLNNIDGCILHSGTDVYVENVNFTSNHNQVAGGAISIETSFPSKVNILSCIFMNNTVSSNSGPGFGGAISVNSIGKNVVAGLVVNVTGCHFEQNSAAGNSFANSSVIPAPAFGGAISSFGASQLSIENSTFQQNAVIGGDGIITFTYGIVRNEVFIQVPSGAGGGAIFTKNSPLSVKSSDFEGNSILPGAFVGFDESSHTSTMILKAYFANGACLFSVFDSEFLSGPDTLLDNCTFLGNTVNPMNHSNLNVEGGLISVQNNLTISNVNFVSNTISGAAVEGGMIFGNDSIALVDATFFGNVINADSLSGGLIYHNNMQATQLNLTQNLFDIQTSAKGFGIFTTTGITDIERAAVVFNAGYGTHCLMKGIIYAESSASVVQSEFSGNHLEGEESYGGVLFLNSTNNADSIVVEQCLFADNALSSTKLSQGGAAWIASSNAIFSNSTFSRNSAAFGGSCAITSSCTFSDTVFANNTAYRAGGAIYYTNIFTDSSPFAFCNSTDFGNEFSNNTSPSGERCASVITSLGFPPDSIEASVVFPYQAFTLAFALVDQFGNILEDPDIIVIGNTNSDAEFSISLPSNTQSAADRGVYVFPDCKFITSSKDSHSHHITFMSSSSSGKYEYSLVVNFTVTTCPPNTESADSTTSACLPCEYGSYSMVPDGKQGSCKECGDCVSLHYLGDNYLLYDSQAMIELQPFAFEDLQRLRATGEPINSILTVNEGYWPVPTTNNFINPTDLIECERCLPFFCINAYYSNSESESNWNIDCSYAIISEEGEGKTEGEAEGEPAKEVKYTNQTRCFEGYTDRMCSKCEFNYFPKGEEILCIECRDSDWTILYILFDILITVILIGLAVKFRNSLLGLCIEVVASFTLFLFGLESLWNFFVISAVFLVLFFMNSHVNHGILKSFIFYFQTSALVVRPLFGWELPEFAESTFARNGLACYFPDLYPVIKFFMIMFMPIVIMCLVVLMYFLGMIYYCRKLKSSDNYQLLGDQRLDDPNRGSLIEPELEQNQNGDDNQSDNHTEADIDSKLEERESIREKIDLWPAKCVKVLIFLLYIMFNLISEMVISLFLPVLPVSPFHFPVPSSLFSFFSCLFIITFGTCFIFFLLFTDSNFMQLFENFSCSFEPDGHGYLNKYPWIQCSIYDTQYFLGLFLPSILFTTLYTVGFPFIIFVLLFKNRKDLHSKKMKIKYGFLFDNYKDHLVDGNRFYLAKNSHHCHCFFLAQLSQPRVYCDIDFVRLFHLLFGISSLSQQN